MRFGNAKHLQNNNRRSGIGRFALGGWAYASPYWTLQGLRSAALNHDAAALNQYIDFEALRTNLKAQFAARLAANNASSPRFDPEYAATRMESVDKMVDGIVSPQAIEVAMDRVSSANERTGSFEFEPIRRSGINKFDLPIDPSDTIALKFERRGLGWQVTDIKLPYDLKRAFAQPTDLAISSNPE